VVCLTVMIMMMHVRPIYMQTTVLIVIVMVILIQSLLPIYVLIMQDHILHLKMIAGWMLMILNTVCQIHLIHTIWMKMEMI
ncbi:uncharacterized protein METZ01_LOCUS274330, partial [marine metagenome]